MKERKLTIFFVILFWGITSCNITYKVRNQHHELEHFLYFPCGKVGFELIGKGDSKFIFRQNFVLDRQVDVFSDSVKFFLNGLPINPDVRSEVAPDILKVAEIEGHKKKEIFFETGRGVFEGDTIAIFAERYVKCGTEFIAFDTIYYTFANRVRIYGVNAL